MSQIHPFTWGVSASAAQTEGAVDTDGKGASIWDDFISRKGKIRDGSKHLSGTDFYHRYREDIQLINALGIRNFRFSISWPRIYPEGTGNINIRGLDYYDRVVDCCLENNVTPWITLYHWDLPSALEQKGGWTNRDITGWFSDYVLACCSRLGDRVKNWMVLNEPLAFCGAGYFLGMHAPARTGRKNFVAAAHHAVLATGLGAIIIKNQVKDPFVGSTFSMSLISPSKNNANDVAAAQRTDDLLNKFFLYPALGKGYPLQHLKFLNSINELIRPGDEQLMKAPLDFIGIQNYTRDVLRHNLLIPFIKASMVSAKKRKVPFTEMGWEVYPEAIYQVLKSVSRDTELPLIVTENGAAFADVVAADGSINDSLRQKFIEDNITQIMKAKNEGVNLQGYFVWSMTDNFEWAEGYRPRFGLVHIDYNNNLERKIKNSGKWYSEWIRKS